MQRALVAFVALAFVGCAFGRAPEGNPSPSDAARARLHDDAERATHTATARAVATARAGSDERTTRKALDLLAAQPAALGDGDNVAWTSGVGTASGCRLWRDAARTLHAGKLEKQALDVETHALDTCHEARGGIAAAQTLKSMERCKDAVDVARRAYPLADVGVRVDVLDTIAACSDATDLETNLKLVVTGDALKGYLADRSARICEGRCEQARSECDSGCGNWSACYSECNALERACASGCR